MLIILENIQRTTSKVSASLKCFSKSLYRTKMCIIKIKVSLSSSKKHGTWTKPKRKTEESLNNSHYINSLAFWYPHLYFTIRDNNQEITLRPPLKHANCLHQNCKQLQQGGVRFIRNEHAHLQLLHSHMQFQNCPSSTYVEVAFIRYSLQQNFMKQTKVCLLDEKIS